uniref:MAP7 domain containing 3 n=1 Tax=Peromyscus maniculatus bairdii TaxID=230844 RepID=A0A8C8VZN7_PERMB
MADPAFAGISGNTSLRSLRERLAAMAQELAEERRRKRGINSSAVTTKRSSCTPDGSVLKNDIKQQLAKERREERKRQQEANKEKQLLEKEQKAKVQYEKQLEERHRKLREQKEKDERRRVSAEEKRKQKQAEDKEKFKAVVSRTMERCNRVDQRQKRWSWEGGATNIDKSGKTESKRSSSLNRKDNQLHSNVALEHVDNTPGMTKYVFRYVTVPMFTSDELKSSTMFCKSSVKMPVPAKLEVTPTKKVETPLKEDVERPAKVNAETLPRMSVKVPSQANLEEPSKANVEITFQNLEDISEVKVDVSPKVNNEEVLADVNSTRHPESNVEELPTVNVDASSSVEPSPVVSEDSSPVLSTGSSSFVSVEISPVVSMDASPEASTDTSPELSTDSASAVASEGNLETSPKSSGEFNLETSVEARHGMNVEASPPKNLEVGKRSINLTTKKQLPSHIPCYRWPSSPTLGWRPPSPMKAVQNQKIRPPSPLPVSRLSAKTSLLYKVTPVQNILYVPNALSMITKKKEIVQKRMINTESGNRSMPSSEAAMKVSVETHHAAFEQTGNKESEGKGNNTTMKSQDLAEIRRKEQEKIMLQNLQERLERKKVILCCMCFVLKLGMKTLTKHKKYHKNAKRRPPKLVFLQAGSGKVDTEKKIHFNGNTKAAKQNDPKDSTTQARGIKMPTKKPPTRTVKTRKTREANPTIRSALSVTTNQEWVCDKIIDFSHMTESPVTKTTAGSSRHNSKDSMTAHQAPQAPWDSKKRAKSVSAPLTKVFSQLNLAGGTTDLENPFSYGCSRMAFGGEEEDSGESAGMI